MAQDVAAWMIWYFVAVNAATFVLSLLDKLAAMNFWWRVPEWILLGLSLFGGAPMAKVVQMLTGHKMLKYDYSTSLNLIAFLHLSLAAAFWATSTAETREFALSEFLSSGGGGEEEEEALPRRFGPGS